MAFTPQQLTGGEAEPSQGHASCEPCGQSRRDACRVALIMSGAAGAAVQREMARGGMQLELFGANDMPAAWQLTQRAEEIEAYLGEPRHPSCPRYINEATRAA